MQEGERKKESLRFTFPPAVRFILKCGASSRGDGYQFSNGRRRVGSTDFCSVHERMNQSEFFTLKIEIKDSNWLIPLGRVYIVVKN